MKRKVGRKKDVLSRSSFYGRYKESVLQIHHSCSIANEISEIAGPISGVGQHVPSYCSACLKGRRLVTSLGPILEKCLAVSAETCFLGSRIFGRSERNFMQHSKDSQVKFIKSIVL